MANPHHDPPPPGEHDSSPWHLEEGRDGDDDSNNDSNDRHNDYHHDQSRLHPHFRQYSDHLDDAIPDPSVADSTDMHIRSISPIPEDSTSSLHLPLWLRESQSSLRWRRWVPLPLRTTASFIRDWTKGPQIPQIQRIRPWLPAVQEAPLWLVQRFLPKRWHKAVALTVLYLAWFVTFVAVLRQEAASGYIEGYGVPSSLWCGASLWSSGNECGLDGNNCRPFSNASMAFRCSANCANMHLSTPHPVGDQVLDYEPLVVGGPPEEEGEEQKVEREEEEQQEAEKKTEREERRGERHNAPAIYRADSFICQAAVHAGVVSNDHGGCGVLHLTGSQSGFSASDRNGIKSHGFNSSFPKSYTFDTTIPTECGVVDLRWPLLVVTVVFTSLISLFVTSPAVFFSSVFTMLFFHVGLVSDKPNISDYTYLFSIMIGRFLPAALAASVIYRFSIRPQLTGLTAQIEKTVLWLGGAWIGSLSNYTLDFIPIQRLTPHDIRSQPGALVSLILICIMLFAIACGQIYYLRLEGRLRRYLLIYAAMAVGLLIGVALPDLHLRIHHYILALLLLPGTRPQTRPGLLYQGLLVGLFVNGTARWGFDSLLQTAAALYSGGGESTGSLLPNITATVVGGNTSFAHTFSAAMDKALSGSHGSGTIIASGDTHGSAETSVQESSSSSDWGISFSWPPYPPPNFDGLSILVNDVERHRWYVGEGASAWTWAGDDASYTSSPPPPSLYYFRFALMAGSEAADYTHAGVWDAASGRWQQMPPGAVGDLALER